MSSHAFLSKTLVEEFGVPSDEIRPEATMVDLGLDSLSAAELIEELEREFEIEITGDQAMFNTLAEAVVIVDDLISAKGD